MAGRRPKSTGERLRTRIKRQFEADDVAGEVILDAICAEADLIESLERAIAHDGSVIDGARGQRVAHPALVPLARHRKLLVDLMHQAFPEDRSERAKAAARARWLK